MAVAIKFYDSFAELIGDGSIDLDAAAHFFHMLVVLRPDKAATLLQLPLQLKLHTG